jgi:hypothetical protein
MRVARGLPNGGQPPYRFNALLAPKGTPLPSDYTSALKFVDHKPKLSTEQEQLQNWAVAIIDSSRVDENRKVTASIPGEAGDIQAIHALDLYFRLKLNRPLGSGSLYGAVDFSKLGQILSSSKIVPPQPAGTKSCRTISVLLDPPETLRLSFDDQKTMVKGLKGEPADRIEQLLAALILKCRAPEKRPFRGLVRNADRGHAIIDTDTSGIRLVTDSGDPFSLIFMSILVPLRATNNGVRVPHLKPKDFS